MERRIWSSQKLDLAMGVVLVVLLLAALAFALMASSGARTEASQPPPYEQRVEIVRWERVDGAPFETLVFRDRARNVCFMSVVTPEAPRTVLWSGEARCE